MKRILTLLLALAVALILPACGGTGTGGSNTGGTSIGGSDSSGGTTQPPEEKPAPTPVEGDEMIDILSSTPYKTNISNADYGVTDASEIGADEAAFSRVLYPVPESVDHTYNAADYGVTLDGKSNAFNLNVLINDIKNVEGTKKIVFEKGVYTLETTIQLTGISDLYFVGDGTELAYSNWCSAFKLRDSKNIHFNDISVD